MEALCRDLSALFANAYRHDFDEKGESARFCLVHGDTTRDLHVGVNRNWTIVGTAMAEVNKLEQACKSLPGRLFANAAALGDRPAHNWTLVAGSEETQVILSCVNHEQVSKDAA